MTAGIVLWQQGSYCGSRDRIVTAGIDRTVATAWDRKKTVHRPTYAGMEKLNDELHLLYTK